jgi:rod shape determining protein RodA
MWLIDRRYLHSFDWVSFLVMLIISGIGLLFVLSATYSPAQPYSLFFKKQLFGILTGLIIYFVCCSLDYRTLERAGYFMYFVILLLLVVTIVKGSIGMGAQRWINVGFTKFQPAELAKLFFPAFVTYYLATEQQESGTLKLQNFIPVLIVLSLSFVLIRMQPDLGTSLIVLFSGAILLWLAGLSKKFFWSIFLLLCLSAPIVYASLKPYQKTRIMVFLGAGDSKKERYQIEQSRIAIGSGGFEGKGLLNGTQNTFNFLPESRTDFIFAVICEEWGFLGALIILFLYTVLFMRLFMVIGSIKNFFAQLLALGLIIHIILSALINMCMVMGLMPIVGIPLPFLSYGISNLWISFASLGWFNSIAMRRFYLSLSAKT